MSKLGGLGGGINWALTPFREPVLLGQGAMGAVFKAWDSRTGREVALKVMRAPSARARERFLREAQLSAALAHPNVVKTHELFSLGELDALVSEVVESPRALDQAWAPLDLRARVRLLREAVAGVAAAHAQGIVHRDLKPENLLVDPQGRVRVADFGVAYGRSEERLTLTGEALGSPGFMPPEQLTGGRAVGPTLDVWALGVILYLALCDELPFRGSSYVEQVALAASGLSSAQRQQLTRASRGLAELVQRCLQSDPGARPASAGEVGQALDAWLAAPEFARSGSRLPLLLGAATALALGGVALYLVSEGPPAGVLDSPAQSASASPSPSASAPQEEASAAEARALAHDAPLVRYRAAATILRRGPEHPLRAEAERVVKELERSPLATISLERAPTWRGYLGPGSDLLLSTGSGLSYAWSPEGGLRPLPPLPTSVSRRTFFDAAAGEVLIPSRAGGGTGVFACSGSTPWRWLAPPRSDAPQGSAAARLAGGELVWGGRGYLASSSFPTLAVRVAGEADLEPLSLAPWGAGVLGLWIKADSDGPHPILRLLYHDPRTGDQEHWDDIPGRNGALAPHPRGESFLIVNYHYAQVLRRAGREDKALAVFTPTLAQGPLGSLDCFWGPSARDALIFFPCGGPGVEARLDSWDAEQSSRLRWTRPLGRALSATPGGPARECVVVGYADRVRIYGLPLADLAAAAPEGPR